MQAVTWQCGAGLFLAMLVGWMFGALWGARGREEIIEALWMIRHPNDSAVKASAIRALQIADPERFGA